MEVETSVPVRARASWALANLLNLPSLGRCLDGAAWRALALAMLSLMDGATHGAVASPPPPPHSKVVPNAVRALGNLSRWLHAPEAPGAHHGPQGPCIFTA